MFQVITSYQGGRLCEGRYLLIVLRIISRTNVRSYETEQTYMYFILKVMVQQSSTRPALISLMGGVTYLCQSKDCGPYISYHRWSQEGYYCFAESLFDTMKNLDPENKLADLHMFDGASVCRKAKKVQGCIFYAVMYFWSRAYLTECV